MVVVVGTVGMVSMVGMVGGNRSFRDLVKK